MAERTPRFLWHNLSQLSATAIAVSSQQASFPAYNIKDYDKNMVWRSKLGWNVAKGFNDIIPFTDDEERIAIIEPGSYPSGSLMGSAVVDALDAAGYSPTHSPNLKAWWRADAGVTVNSSGVVTGWADQSGNGYDLTKGSAASPTFLANAVNGRPSVVMDDSQNTSWNFTGPAVSNLFDASGDGCVIAVVRTPVASSATARWVMGATASYQNGIYYASTTSYLRSQSYDPSSKGAVVAINYDEWAIICFQRSADTTLYCGYNDLDTAAMGSTALVGGLTPSGDLCLFFCSVVDQSLGQLAEMMVFDASSFAELSRQGIDVYLAAKYGITTTTTPAAHGNAYSVSYASDKFTAARASGSDSVSLDWNTGSHQEALGGEDLGYDVSADDTGSTSYTADNESYHSREYLKIDLGAAFAVSYGAVLNHVPLGTGGVISVQGNTADCWDSPAVDEDLSGNDDVQIDTFTEASYRYWRVHINDVGNEVGYSQVGLFYVGIYDEPSRGIRQGYQDGLAGLDGVIQADYGTVYQLRKISPKVWSVTFPRLRTADKEAMMEMYEFVGIGRGFIFALDPLNNPATQTRYVFLSSDMEFIHSVGDGSPPDRWTITINFREAI